MAMRRVAVILIFVTLAAVGCSPTVPKRGDMTPFPVAPGGEARHVIRLPAAGDEDALRVELVVGRRVLADCNQQWFGGKLERDVSSGWDHPVYRMTSVAGPATTMKACPESDLREAFVRVRFENPFVPYDSSAPLVVYVPQGFVVRYRIWQGQQKLRDAATE